MIVQPTDRAPGIPFMAAPLRFTMIWEDHLSTSSGRNLPHRDGIVHEVTSRRLRGAAADRPQGSRAEKDAAGGRPQRPPTDRTSPIRTRKRRESPICENAKLFGLEYYDEFDRCRASSHHRPSGLHAAGYHARVRRQPYRQLAPSVRRLRHRHVRGRACTAPRRSPEEIEEHARWSTAGAGRGHPRISSRHHRQIPVLGRAGHAASDRRCPWKGA